MQLLIPALDTCFLRQSSQICYDDITHMAKPCSSIMSFYVDETIESLPESESENYARMILTLMVVKAITFGIHWNIDIFSDHTN